MNISKISQQLIQTKDRNIISTLQLLVFLMKKFGKALNSSVVLDMIIGEYPDVVTLYRILGGSRCSVARCQQLLVSVARSLDYNHLEVFSFHQVSLDILPEDFAEYSTFDSIGLSVVGKGNRVYKRSLGSDLAKMMR